MAAALGDLPRAHCLLPAVLLVQFQLLQPVLRDLSLYIFTLALTILPVFLKNLEEVLYTAESSLASSISGPLSSQHAGLLCNDIWSFTAVCNRHLSVR